jgi:hypothetical protein
MVAIGALSAFALLVGVSPAAAVDLPFTVVSPADGTASASRTPSFTGTGAEGAAVTVTPAAGVAPAVSTTVAADGTWVTPAIAYGVTAAANQQVVVTHTLGATVETASISFTLPAVPAAGAIVITSPVNGTRVGGYRFVIEGTAPAGSLVNYTPSIGDGYALPITVGASGTFSIEEFMTPSPYSQTFEADFTGTTSDGLPLTPARLSVLAAEPLPAPVVTSPRPGASIAGSSVTFTGTGIPGREVSVSAYVPDLPLGEFERYSRVGTAFVDARGAWRVTIQLLPATYLSSAAYVETYPSGGAVVSDFSPDLSFRLAAAQTAGAAPELAATGASAAGTLALGALLSLLGVAAVVGRRMAHTVGSR